MSIKYSKQEIDEHLKDVDEFIKRWDKNKKCKCEDPNCRHYKRAYNKTELSNRTVELFDSMLISNIKRFNEITRRKK